MTPRTLLNLLLLAGACALAPSALGQTGGQDADEANPVLVPGAPWHFDAFVVNAPEGEDWASFSKSATGAELGKKFGDGRTAAVVVESTQFDDSVQREADLLRATQRLHAAAPDPAAMKLVSFEQVAVTPKGVLCARSTARFEDRVR